MADSVLSKAVLLECEAGETLIKEGDDTKFFCILLKGAVKIVKDGKKIAEVSESGQMLGELAMVTEHARTASVVAVRHTFCLKVEPDFLEGVSDSEGNAFYARLYQFVAQLLGERLEEAAAHIAKLEEKIRVLSGGSVSEDSGGGEPGVYRI